jgi:hypothetical protein
LLKSIPENFQKSPEDISPRLLLLAGDGSEGATVLDSFSLKQISPLLDFGGIHPV